MADILGLDEPITTAPSTGTLEISGLDAPVVSGTGDVGDVVAPSDPLDLPWSSTDDGTQFINQEHPLYTTADRFIVKNPALSADDRQAYLERKFQSVKRLGDYAFLVQNEGDAGPYTIDPELTLKNLFSLETLKDNVVDVAAETARGMGSVTGGAMGAGNMLMGSAAGAASGYRAGGLKGAFAGFMAGATPLGGAAAGAAQGFTVAEAANKALIRAVGDKPLKEELPFLPSVQETVEGPVIAAADYALKGVGSKLSKLEMVQRASSAVNEFFNKLGMVSIQEKGAPTAAEFLTKGQGSARKLFTSDVLNSNENVVIPVYDHSRQLIKDGLFRTTKVQDPIKLQERFLQLKAKAERATYPLYRKGDDALNGHTLSPYALFDPTERYPQFGTDPNTGLYRTLNEWARNRYTGSKIVIDPKTGLDVEVIEGRARAALDVGDLAVSELEDPRFGLNFNRAKSILQKLYRETNYDKGSNISLTQTEDAAMEAKELIAGIIRSNINKQYDAMVSSGAIKGKAGELAEANTRMSAYYALEPFIARKQASALQKGITSPAGQIIDAANDSGHIGGTTLGLLTSGALHSSGADPKMATTVGLLVAAGFTGRSFYKEVLKSDVGSALRLKINDAIQNPTRGVADAATEAAVLARSAGMSRLYSLLSSPEAEAQQRGLYETEELINQVEKIDAASQEYGIDLLPFASADVFDGIPFLEDEQDQHDYLYELNVRAQNGEIPYSHIATQASQFNSATKPNIVLKPPTAPKPSTMLGERVKNKKATATQPASYDY